MFLDRIWTTCGPRQNLDIIENDSARTSQSRPDVVAHVVSRAAHLGRVVEGKGAVHVGRPRAGAALDQYIQRLHFAAYCN